LQALHAVLSRLPLLLQQGSAVRNLPVELKQQPPGASAAAVIQPEMAVLLLLLLLLLMMFN
jgi:hypothetical protein